MRQVIVHTWTTSCRLRGTTDRIGVRYLPFIGAELSRAIPEQHLAALS
jgi:hypothetical protein